MKVEVRRLLPPAVMCVLVAGCTTRVFELPAGYTGWVVVEHGVVGCAPLPIEHSAPIHRIPAGGALCTSDPKESGWLMRDQYYEAGAARIAIPTSGPPTARRIWSPGDGENGPYQFDAFFIGTWAQHEADLGGMGEVLQRLHDEDGIGTPVPQVMPDNNELQRTKPAQAMELRR